MRAALTAPRDPAKLQLDVRQMRGMIEAEKGSDDIWDIKQVAGGLVDVEFIAQYLVLRHASSNPDLIHAHTGTALYRLSAAGHLSAAEAEILLPALALYGGLTQVLRLAQDGVFRPDEANERLRALLARAADLPSFAVLEAHLRETTRAVRASFIRIVGEPIA